MHHEKDRIVKAFLDGYNDGDGEKNPGKPIRAMKTSSKILALQLQQLYTRFNFLPIITQYKPNSRVIGKYCNVTTHFLVRYYKNGRGKRAKLFENFILVPVVKATETWYEGDIWNLKTEDDTYVVFNAVVHNCGAPLNEVKRVPIFIRDQLRLTADEEYVRAKMGLPLPTVHVEMIDVPPTMKVWVCGAESPHYFERDAVGKLVERSPEYIYRKILRERAKIEKLFPAPEEEAPPTRPRIPREVWLEPPDISPHDWIKYVKKIDDVTWWKKMTAEERKRILDEYEKLCWENVSRRRGESV
jgi:hypothetical protein